MSSTWDASKVREMLANPVYVGVGPYPAIVTNESWIKSFKSLVADIGLDEALALMLGALQKTEWNPSAAVPA